MVVFIVPYLGDYGRRRRSGGGDGRDGRLLAGPDAGDAILKADPRANAVFLCRNHAQELTGAALVGTAPRPDGLQGLAPGSRKARRLLSAAGPVPAAHTARTACRALPSSLADRVPHLWARSFTPQGPRQRGGVTRAQGRQIQFSASA